MFCNTCGSKLRKEDLVCPDCGAPADQGETCGGFWGLVGAAPVVTPLPPEPPAPPAPPVPPVPSKTETEAEKENAKFPFPLVLPNRVLYGLVAVLAVLLLVQTIRIGGLNRRLKTQESLSKTYWEWYNQALSDNQELTEQLDLAEETEPETTEATEPETTEPTEPETTEATEPETTEVTEPDSTELADTAELPETTEIPEDTEPEQTPPATDDVP